MKRYLIISFIGVICLICAKYTDAQEFERPSFLGKFNSFEVIDSTTSSLNFNITLFFNDTIAAGGLLEASIRMPGITSDTVRINMFTLSDFETIAAKQSGNYLPGDSIICPIVITFDKSQASFSVMKINVSVAYVGETIVVPVYIYVTPYNSVEVWNIDDYEMLPRKWSFDGVRNNSIQVHRSDIPQSNITNEDLANDSILKSWYSINGLAYSIPCYEILDTFDLLPVNNDLDTTNGNPKADGCANNFHRWKGTISGHLSTMVQDDRGDNFNMSIAGIQVEIWDRDNFPNSDDHLGTAFTDDNGNFSIYINTCQRYQGSVIGSSNEGNTLEIYFTVVGRNEDKSIKVIRRDNTIRKVDVCKNNVIQWGYNNGNDLDLNQSVIFAGDESQELKPQLLHWARKSRNYINQELIAVGFSLPENNDPLIIKITPLTQKSGCFFFPGGYLDDIFTVLTWFAPGLVGTGVAANFYLSNNDGLYISTETEYDEDFILHEFGHYIMWHLQGESWNELIDDSFTNHSIYYNCWTEKLAWSEGWANGMGAILDAAISNDDNEYSFDGNCNFECRSYHSDFFTSGAPYEDRTFPITYDGVWRNDHVFTHGMVSELCIASFIYDLWDGFSEMSSFNYAPNCPENGGKDRVSLSLIDITKPLRDHTGTAWSSSSVIQNIFQYIRTIRDYYNCDVRKNISDIAKLNRLYALEDNNPHHNVEGVSLDIIEHDSGGRFKQFKKRSDSWTFEQTDNFISYVFDLNSIRTDIGSWNLGVSGTTIGYECLIDDLEITDQGKLYINRNAAINQYNLYPTNETPVQGSELVVSDLSDRIAVRNGGKMAVGDINGNHADFQIHNKALLQISSGGILDINNNSIIRVKDGGSLLIGNNSTVNIIGTGKIVIEPGGYLCIEPDAQISDLTKIQFDDNSAYIGINPDNVYFSQTSHNCGYFDCGGLVYYEYPTELNVTVFTPPLVDIDGIVKFREDLRIQAFVNYQINNLTLEFSEGKRIIIEPGAHLTLSNTILQGIDECDNFWQGVEVMGSSNFSQNSGAQGKLELIGTTKIETAICAISIGQIDNNGIFVPGTSGGIVKATNVNFENCINAVRYAPYKNMISGVEQPNVGRFINCIFNITEKIYNVGYTPDAFVKLEGVSGIYFKGCDFQNNDVSHLESFRGNGIFSSNSRFFVTGLCPSMMVPCPSWDNSKFKNLEYGIKVQNTIPSYSVSIRNTEFENNFRGASLIGVLNPEFNNNHVNVGANKNSAIQSQKYSSVGLYMEGCQGYLVQNNDFSSTHAGRYGVIIANSGKRNERINNNNISNLQYGIQAEGRNGAYAILGGPVNLSNGLLFKCNVFSNNSSFDIGVTNFTHQGGAITQGLINRNQGSCASSSAPALNSFLSNPSLQNLYGAAGIYPFNYYAFTSNNTTSPTVNSPLINVILCNVGFSSTSCVLPNPYVIDISGTMNTVLFRTTEINTLNGLFDGGNTQTLLNTIALTNISSQTLRDALMTASPYLTDTVLIAAIKRAQQMTPGHTKDVMIANSSLTTKVMKELTKVQLPPGIRKQILNAQQGNSPRAAVEQQISDKQYELSYATDELVRALLNDTATIGYNEISNFFSTIPNIESKKIAAQAYLASSNCSGVQSMLNQIPQTTADNANFVKYYTVMSDLCSTGKSIDSMTSSQLIQIQDVAISGGELSVNARIILAMLADSTIEETIEEIILPDSMSIRGNLYESTDCGSNAVAGDTLVLRDFYGNIVREVSPVVTDQSGWFQFNAVEIAMLKKEKYAITSKGSFAIDSTVYFEPDAWLQNSPVTLNLSSVSEIWQSGYNSPDSIFASGQSVVIQGSIYSVGTAYNQNKDKDIVIVKNDPMGNILWSVLYNSGTGADDEAAGIYVDSIQNVYVLGSVGSIGHHDISVLKYDSNGTYQWATRYNYHDMDDKGVKISRDNTGSILVAGTVVFNPERMDVAALKYSPSGQLLWTNIITGYDQKALFPVGFIADAAGQSTLFVTDTAARAKTTIVKYASNGTSLYNASINDYNACSVISDAMGNFYLAGNNSISLEVNIKKLDADAHLVWSVPMYGSMVNSPSSDYLLMDSLGNLTAIDFSKMGFLVARINAAGAKQWEKEVQGSWFHFLNSLDMTMDKFGNTYISATAEYKDNVLTNYVYLYKFDPTGNRLWSQEIKRNTASDITVSKNLNVYLNGTNLYYANNSSTPTYGLVTHKYSQCYSAINLRSQEQQNHNNTGAWYFNLYPNPNNGSMEISYSMPAEEKGRFEIYDQTGRIVFTKDLVGGLVTLPITVEGMNAGMYYYRAYTPIRSLVNERVVIIK